MECKHESLYSAVPGEIVGTKINSLREEGKQEKKKKKKETD